MTKDEALAYTTREWIKRAEARLAICEDVETRRILIELKEHLARYDAERA